MMPDITVSLTSSRLTYGFGEAVDLSVVVQNVTNAPLFVITGPAYIWKGTGNLIEVLVGEAEAGDDFCYYAYAPPHTRRLGPGRQARIPVSVGMPPRDSFIDAKGAYGWRELPVAGDVIFEIRVGYLRRTFRPRTTGPWAEFVAAQGISSPVSVTLHIEPH
jgi:hypothetical protein